MAGTQRFLGPELTFVDHARRQRAISPDPRTRNGRIECAVGGVGLNRAIGNVVIEAVRSHGAKVADGLGGAACRTHGLRRQHLDVGLSHVGVDARVSLDVLPCSCLSRDDEHVRECAIARREDDEGEGT